MSRIRVLNPETMAELAEYLQHHFDFLAEISEGVHQKQTADEYRIAPGSVQLDNSGNGVVELDGVQGYDRTLERVSIMVTGATAGNVALFTSSVTPLTLREFIPSAQLSPVTIAPLGQVVAYSDAFNNSIHISYQEKLLVQFSGFAAGAIASVSLQEKKQKKADDNVHHFERFRYGDA